MNDSEIHKIILKHWRFLLSSFISFVYSPTTNPIETLI